MATYELTDLVGAVQSAVLRAQTALAKTRGDAGRRRAVVLSLEFDCEPRREERNREGGACVFGVALGTRRRGKGDLRRMQIVVRGHDAVAGEVRLDGRVLAEVPLASQDAGVEPAVGRLEGLLRRLLKWWRALWSRQELLMRGEPAQRARRICGRLRAGETARQESERGNWKP